MLNQLKELKLLPEYSHKFKWTVWKKYSHRDINYNGFHLITINVAIFPHRSLVPKLLMIRVMHL